MAIANCFVKKSIAAKLDEKYNFATIVYSTVKVSIFVQIGQGIGIIKENKIIAVITVI